MTVEGNRYADAGQAPGLLVRGRYALVDLPDGRMQLPWSTGPCERCATCGCGEQMDPFELPVPMAALIRARINGEDLPMLGKLKAMRRR